MLHCFRITLYKLQLTSRTAGMDKLPIKERWAPSTFDREAFLCSQEGALLEGTAEEKTQSLSRAITAACNASMSTRSNPRGRSLVYWWSEDIATICRECLRARGLHQRAARGTTCEELRVAYERKRRELKTAIKMVKRKCWRDLCKEADSDPWGRPYKAVMNKIKPRGPNAPTCSLSRYGSSPLVSSAPGMASRHWPDGNRWQVARRHESRGEDGR